MPLICCASVQSAFAIIIFDLVALAISCAACASSVSPRAQIATDVPSRANESAMALPIPWLPPVTRAVLFDNSVFILRLQFRTSPGCSSLQPDLDEAG